MVVLKITGCGGCTITGVNFRTQEAVGKSKVVQDKRVTFRIPTSKTAGLGWFVENSSPNADYSAQVLAVARYKGKSAGELVTPKEAKAATKGTQCWAGTTRDSVTLTMKVRHYATTNPMGEPADGIRAYFSPTLKSVGKPWATHNGSLLTQTVVSCSG